MKTILTLKEAIDVSKELRKQGKSIVLGGGCFDILHPGHIAYLKGAKQKGDILFILLESDATIKRTKGKDRPIHTQPERAVMLASIIYLDYVVLLPEFTTDDQYDKIVTELSPKVIAITENDPKLYQKKRQAESICGIIQTVTNYIPNRSTSKLAKKLGKEL